MLPGDFRYAAKMPGGLHRRTVCPSCRLASRIFGTAFFVALFWDVVAFWILITAILGFFAFRDGQSLQSGRAPTTAEDMK